MDKGLPRDQAGIEVEMSQKKLHRVKGDHLLTELLQTGDKVNVKLSDYVTYNQRKGEGTLPDFWNKIYIPHNNTPFKYLLWTIDKVHLLMALPPSLPPSLPFSIPHYIPSLPLIISSFPLSPPSLNPLYTLIPSLP